MSARPPTFPPSSTMVAEPDQNPAADAATVTDALSDRLAERRRARRRLRIRALVFVLCGVLLIAGGGYLALASPVLALRASDVSVTGDSEFATAEQIAAVVAPAEGTPLLRIDTGALAQQISELNGVRQATVVRAFPHGLEITVQARVPVASVRQGGGYLTLDSDGVELARTTEPAAGVPLVRVPIGSEATSAALEAVLQVLAAMPPELLAQVTQASATSAHEVEFTLASGAEVIWGSAEQSELKASVLSTLLQVPAQVYDVSAPLSPITR
ncbi:MAG: cell division protein FtsQ/DivIB [Beutenbergiaceae bacterium]